MKNWVGIISDQGQTHYVRPGDISQVVAERYYTFAKDGTTKIWHDATMIRGRNIAIRTDVPPAQIMDIIIEAES